MVGTPARSFPGQTGSPSGGATGVVGTPARSLSGHTGSPPGGATGVVGTPEISGHAAAAPAFVSSGAVPAPSLGVLISLFSGMKKPLCFLI